MTLRWKLPLVPIANRCAGSPELLLLAYVVSTLFSQVGSYTALSCINNNKSLLFEINFFRIYEPINQCPMRINHRFHVKVLKLYFQHCYFSLLKEQIRLFVCSGLTSLSTIFHFSHITMVSGCDRELNAHFYSAASLKYLAPDT